MIDPDDGRNINQNTSWLFAQKLRLTFSSRTAYRDRDIPELLSKNNEEKKMSRT